MVFCTNGTVGTSLCDATRTLTTLSSHCTWELVSAIHLAHQPICQITATGVSQQALNTYKMRSCCQACLQQRLRSKRCLLFRLDGQGLVLQHNWRIDNCRCQQLLRHHLRHSRWVINHLHDRIGHGNVHDLFEILLGRSKDLSLIDTHPVRLQVLF